jgi:hypothetical protein
MQGHAAPLVLPLHVFALHRHPLDELAMLPDIADGE